MNALVPAPPSRQELEALTLAERVQLEDAFGQAHEVIRELNDAEIARLASEGRTQTEIAELAGCHQSRISRTYARLGIEPTSNRGRPRNMQAHNSENGDDPHDAEVVDGEVVPDNPDITTPERPERYMPDEVSNDADRNLRTQTLRWFEQGLHLEELLNEGVVATARDREDRAAIKREASHMAAVARRLKGAF